MILPIYGSVEKLDESLLEAAADLGAGADWNGLARDSAAHLPGVAAGVLLVFVPVRGNVCSYVHHGGGRVTLIGDAIEQQFGSGGNIPVGAALGVALLALFLLSALLVQRRRGVNGYLG